MKRYQLFLVILLVSMFIGINNASALTDTYTINNQTVVVDTNNLNNLVNGQYNNRLKTSTHRYVLFKDYHDELVLCLEGQNSLNLLYTELINTNKTMANNHQNYLFALFKYDFTNSTWVYVKAKCRYHINFDTVIHNDFEQMIDNYFDSNNDFNYSYVYRDDSNGYTTVNIRYNASNNYIYIKAKKPGVNSGNWTNEFSYHITKPYYALCISGDNGRYLKFFQFDNENLTFSDSSYYNSVYWANGTFSNIGSFNSFSLDIQNVPNYGFIDNGTYKTLTYNVSTIDFQYIYTNAILKDDQNNVIYNKNDIFNYRSFSYYEDIINCNGLSKIIFNFEQNNDSLDIDFYSDFNELLLTKPYLEFIKDDNSDITNFTSNKIDLEAQDINNYELYSLSEQFGIDLIEEYDNIRIVIDVSGYGDYDYHYIVRSSLPMTIETISYSDEFDYWQTIDLDGKYGVYLMPKNLNHDLVSNIYLRGNYDIDIMRNYVDKDNFTLDEHYSNYSSNVFSRRFQRNFNDFIIYFKNLNYNTENDSNSYITIDTRYYNYSMVDYEGALIEITNPNDNNVIQITNENGGTSAIGSFLNDASMYISGFSELLNYAFVRLNNNIKKFLIAIFVLFLLCALYLTGRGKR